MNNELKGNMVKLKEENLKNMIVEDYLLKLLIENNYWFLGTDGGGLLHPFHGSMSHAGI